MRVLSLAGAMLFAGSAAADTIKATAVSATAGASSAGAAQDGDRARGWQPGGAAGALTFDFGEDTYLSEVDIEASAATSATLETSAGTRSDIALEAGQNAVALPTLLCKQFTIEVRSAPPGFAINEATFTSGTPATFARPTLRARASSTLDNKKRKYGPQLAIDGKLSTAWNEGARVAKGQWLEIGFNEPAFVHHVGMIVGYSKYNTKVGEVWFKNHRVKAARFDYGNGWYYDAQLEDRIDFQYVPARMQVKKVRIIIDEVYDTLKWEDTPISEVKFIYEYVDDVKLEAAFDQGAVVATDEEPHYLVLRVKGAYSVQAERAPANVALVIDQSGSMSTEDRMLHAREAAKLIIGSLGPRDYLSLISFDDRVYVKKDPTKMTTSVKNAMVQVIDGLGPQGGTNIYDALAEGVKKVRKNLSEAYTNRVLLLSDGEPTSGETSTRAIARVSSDAHHRSGVISSTFGVGADYREELMAKIATSSAGSYYHITNPAQMFKVFVAEMSSIMKVLGRNVSLEVTLPESLEVVAVHGHDFQRDGKRLTISLMPISAADEQKVVIEVKAAKEYPTESAVSAVLKYEDALAGNRKVALTATRILEGTDDAKAAKASRNPVVVAEVLSTLSAEGLATAAASFEKGSEDSARKMLKTHIDQLKRENRTLGSAALSDEIATLEAIYAAMKGNSARSSGGKLAIKEAKAAALLRKKKGSANTSLDGGGSSPKGELQRLVSTNFQDPGPAYGRAKPEAIIGSLVGRGLAKKDAARAANTMGYRAYTRKDYDDALSWFDAALAYESTHVLATYNAACTWGLKKNAGKAVEYLEKLKAIGNSSAKKRLEKARKDSDLDPVRNDKLFKDFMAAL